MNKGSLIELNPESLSEWCAERALPAFRVTQILEWVFQKLVFDFSEMSNLPADLRATLSQTFSVLSVSLQKTESDSDGTRKFVFDLNDAHAIETVFIPGDTGYTLCISSQVGCALGCRFCATGTMGIVRNLSSGEILSQILLARKLAGADDHGNIVFMGMGEPLLNADAVIQAIHRISDIRCMGWSPRRITLSTAGVVPEIKRIGNMNLGINLAVSLNAPDDALRSRLMPINKKYPLKNLIAALKDYPLPSRQHQITFEYVLLRGINDQPQHADKLARLLDRKRDKVNLIPFNPFPGSRYQRPDADSVILFQQRVKSAGITVLVRNSKGKGISAACGQLAGISDLLPNRS